MPRVPPVTTAVWPSREKRFCKKSMIDVKRESKNISIDQGLCCGLAAKCMYVLQEPSFARQVCIEEEEE